MVTPYDKEKKKSRQEKKKDNKRETYQIKKYLRHDESRRLHEELRVRYTIVDTKQTAAYGDDVQLHAQCVCVIEDHAQLATFARKDRHQR